METYTRSNLKDFFLLLKKRLISTKKIARNNYVKYLKIQNDLKTQFNLELKNKKILDIGCGQRYPYTYLLSKHNNVIGIDLDVILMRHDYRNYKAIISKNGFNRFFKTLLRSLLFDRQYFNELSRLSEKSKIPQVVIKHMNAEELKFKDNRFDFVLSILSFEHFKNVEKCVKEVKRVLKKGGKFYISVDVYSKLHGGHEINPKQPWNHLLNKNFKPNVYLNKLRMEEYKAIFSRHFEKIQFICKEDPTIKRLLTPELKNQLSNYSELELTMYPLVIMGEK
jgi:SAM-dependent methyltransferase